jgi:hypothetical protein
MRNGEMNGGDSVNNLPIAAQWSIKNFNSSDNGEYIAQAIKEGTAIAVCDGSYKEGKGHLRGYWKAHLLLEG